MLVFSWLSLSPTRVRGESTAPTSCRLFRRLPSPASIPATTSRRFDLEEPWKIRDFPRSCCCREKNFPRARRRPSGRRRRPSTRECAGLILRIQVVVAQIAGTMHNGIKPENVFKRCVNDSLITVKNLPVMRVFKFRNHTAGKRVL